jgi:hypothetical protein
VPSVVKKPSAASDPLKTSDERLATEKHHER